jgi:hypothetical protein
VADPPKELGHLAAFNFQLMSVGHVLVVTAAAMAKIRADRLDSIWGGNDHLLQSRSIEAFPAFDDLRFDSFPIDREGYESDFPVETANAGAPERDIMDVEHDRRTRCRVRCWFSHGARLARKVQPSTFGVPRRRK